MIFALLACSALPPEIPASAAVLDANNAREAFTIASADLPYLLYATLLQLEYEDFRTCPEYVGNSNAYTMLGDCSDSSLVSWSGTATWSDSGYSSSISFENFGPSGLAGGWKANGIMDVTTARGSTTVTLDSAYTLVQLDAPAKVYSIATVGNFATDSVSGVLFADGYTGTVGIEDAGTLTVDARRVPIAFANGCDYGMGGFGDSTLQGSNTETASFHADSSVAAAADTGDTADTGGAGDTGSASTGTSVCGCPTLALDGVEIDDCADTTRALVYPFFALGE